MADKLNIYQKLIAVRESVVYLKKESSGYQFKYTSSSQVLGSIRAEMDKQGLLLSAQILGERVSDHKTKSDSHEYFTELVMEYTWINADNPDENIVCRWYGQGLDTGEKGVGKALTYAEKYFILKYFNIATDKDDPDAHQNKTNGSGKKTKPTDTDSGTPMKSKIDSKCMICGKDIKKGDPIRYFADIKKAVHEICGAKKQQEKIKKMKGGAGIIDDIEAGKNEWQENLEKIRSFKPAIKKKYGKIFPYYLETLQTTTKNQKLKSAEEINTVDMQNKCIVALEEVVADDDDKTLDTETKVFKSAVNAFIPTITKDGIIATLEKECGVKNPIDVPKERRAEILDKLDIIEKEKAGADNDIPY